MQFADTSCWLRLEPALLEPLICDQAIVHLRHKQPIFYQGDAPQAVYVVKTGRVCITTYSRDGMEQQLYIAEQGALFGEHSCILGTVHTTSSFAIVDSSVYAIPIQIFMTRMQQDPALNQTVMRVMCRKSSLLIERLLTQTSSDSVQRVAQVLIDLAQEYGQQTEEGLEIAIRFSHQDVANLLHTSRVTVTKAFQNLSKMGVILRHQNRIYVRDLKQLETLAAEGMSTQ